MFINILIFLSSCAQFFNVNGDIKVVKMLINEKNHIIPCIFHWALYSNKRNDFLLNKMYQYVNYNINDNKILYAISLLLDWVLVEGKEIPLNILKYINMCTIEADKDNNSYKKNKNAIHVIIHKLIYYEIIINKNFELGKLYYKMILEEKLRYNTLVLSYNLKRTEHILGIRDNSEFLINIKNIRTDYRAGCSKRNK